LVIRGLVERSAGADLAATKLLLELMRRANPRALGPDPAEAAPLDQDALNLLKERLERLARAQMFEQSSAPAAPSASAPEPTGGEPAPPLDE
jgi:hypothetical protein